MAIYESGPPLGKRLVLIHGISTPSIVFTPLIRELTAEGYRVMTFDLFGRGYSDAPQDVPYDERLFSAQVLYALQSSEVGTGWERFSIVGYSFGGGIAVAFAACFPERIEALVLICSSGLQRIEEDAGVLVKLSRRGWVPTAVTANMLKRRLSGKKNHMLGGERKVGGVDFEKVLEWQASEHKGFVGALLSSWKHGPIYDRQEEWREVGRSGIPRIGVMMAEKDDLIDISLLPEMVELLGGQERVAQLVVKEAAHDLVKMKWREVADFVGDVVGDPEGADDDTSMMTGSGSEHVVGSF
jgi:pimeloyl-ACP methyl ester carboxylesterase